MSNEKIIKAGIQITAKADATELDAVRAKLAAIEEQLRNQGKTEEEISRQKYNYLSIEERYLLKADNQLKIEKEKQTVQEKNIKLTREETQELDALDKKIGQVIKSGGDLNKLLLELGQGTALGVMAVEAVKFQSAFADMQKSVQGTAPQMARLKQEIKELSNNLGVSANELMKTAAAAGSFGVATSDLAKFTEVATQMSRVFNISGEEVAQSLANIQKAFQFENTEQLQTFADNLAKLGEVANASEDEMLGVVDAVSTAAHQFGLSANETTALASAFLALGRSPSEASKSIKTLLQKLSTAETQSAGFQAALENIGLSANQLAQDIREKPQAALDEFLQTIKGLDETTQANVLQDLFGDNVGTQIQAVVQNLGEYEKALHSVAKEQDATGKLADKFGDSVETVAGEFAKLKNTVQNTLGTLGETLLPVISAAVKGLGSMADGVAWVVKSFPNLSQLAVILASSKLAIKAATAGFLKLGASGKKAGADIAQGMGGAITSVAALNRELDKTWASIEKAKSKADIENIFNGNGALATIATIRYSLMNLAKAATAAFAAWDIGSSIGKSLYENSDVAAAFGDWLGKGIAYIDAALTDRTVEDVKKHYKTKAEMTAELAREEAAAAARQAALEQQRAEQLAQQKQHIAELKAQYNETTQAIDAQIASLGLLNAENTGSGALYEQITAQIAGLTEKQAALNAEIAQHGEKIAKLAGGSDAVKTALANLGLSLNQLQTGISDSAAGIIADFGTAAEAVGHNAENMQALFSAAVAKMGNATEIDALKAKLQEVGEQGLLTADEIAQIADTAPKTADKVADAFKKIGVDIDAANKGISSGANRAMNDFQAATDAMAAAGEKDAKVIQAAFDEVFKRLKSNEELTQFQAALKASGDMALLSSEQVARLDTAIAQTAQSTQGLGENTAKFGEDAQKAYKQAINAAKEYGNATANATQKASIQVSEVYQKGQAATGGFMAAVDKIMTNVAKVAGASDEAASKIKANAYKMSKVTLASTETYLTRLFKNLKTVTNTHISSTRSAVRWTETLNKKISNGTVSMRDLAFATTATGDRFGTLDKATLSNLQQAIDNAKKKLEEMQNAARQTRQELEKEYAQTVGDTDKVADMEQQAKIKELQEKLAAAHKTGDSVQIAEYQRALKLQKQIGEEKQRQAEAEKVQAEIAEQEKRRQERVSEENKKIATPALQARKDSLVEIDLPQKVEIGNTKGLAEDLARQIGESLNQREKMIVEKALNAFSNEIKQALKRQSR